MALVNVPYPLADGTVAYGSQVLADINAIKNDYNGNIQNVNMAANAAIVDTKLAAISTAGKVSGAALTSLDLIPAGAGVIPSANLPGTASVALGLNYVIDGGGAVITAGSKGYLTVPFAATINSVTLLADQTGSIATDLLKCAYSGFPTTTTITAATPPTITTAQKYIDTTLSSWNTTINAGDIIEFQVTGSPTAIKRLTVAIKITR